MKPALQSPFHFRIIVFSKKKFKQSLFQNSIFYIGLLSILCLVNPLFAQNVNTYDFAQTVGTFTPLIAGTGPVAVPAIKANDATSAALPIGFTFNYAGGNYTSIYASSNGYLSFSGGVLAPPVNGSKLLTNASTGSLAIIAPLWSDLNQSGAPGAALASYQTTGAPGSRVFTFQWLNWQWGQVPITFNQDISFQVKLYEGSDKIEFYYRHEALNTNIINNGASIGLAGPSSGAPDFLCVRFPFTPPTSITVEGQHGSRPADGQIFTFTKSALKDIQAIGLAYPLTTTCGANVPVSVTIKNMGAVPLDFSASPLTLTGSIAGPNPANFSVPVTGTLAVNATLDVVVVPNYDMTAAGTYTFNATANLTGDGRPNNNVMPVATRTVAPIATVPQNVNFTGYDGNNLSTLFPGWSEELLGPPAPTNYNFATGFGSPNNVNLRFLMGWGGISNRWIKGPKVTVTAATQVRFKAAITEPQTFNAQPNAMAGSDDKIYIMVSTDCGTSFTPIYTFDATNTAGITNVLTEQVPISLAAYAGQTIIVGFYATNGTTTNPTNYDFHLDDIFIGTPPATDLGVLSMQTPIATGCYTNAENVTVTIKNFGTSAVDFSTTPAQVQAQVKVTGNPTPTVLSLPLNTGSLAPGATQVVTLLPALNMTQGGNHNFKIFTSLNGDNNKANDTLTITRYNAPTFTLPNSVDFTGYSASTSSQAAFANLFPGWWRTKGITPDPNPSNGGSWGPWNGVGQASNVTANLNLWDNQEKSWLIGPKIAATSTTEFRFKVAITAYPTNNPYPLGMSGTDDKVQVMVSTNCGVSYSPIYTIDASNSGNITNSLSEIVVPLSSFAGQNIIVAIFGTDGAINDVNNYFFHIDDLVLRNVFTTDIAPVKAVTKRSGCGLTATEQICVVVKNEGVTAQSNIPVSFRVNNGPLVSGLIPGPIQPNDTLRYCFTGTANLAANGTYDIKIFTWLAADANIANDTIRHTIVSHNPVPLTNSSGGSRCGAGPITLTASAPNNLDINWYSAATGGTVVGTGTTFTPNVSATTTYYAAAVTGIEKVGRQANVDNLKGSGGGLYFIAHQTFDLKSVVVYTDNAAGGNIVITIRNSASTVLYTKTFNLPPVTGKTAVTIPLDFNNIVPGTDYRLSMNAGLQLYHDQVTTANPIFPFVSPSKTITITGSNNSGFYSYFYDWTIAVCSSSQRSPVVATVNAAPVVNLTNVTQCGTNPVLLDAGNPGSTFQWSLNGNAIAGATNQTYSATAPGTYSVTVTNAGNCTASGTAQVTSSTVAIPTVTAAGPLTFCQGSSVTLTGATTTTGVTYKWSRNGTLITGANSANYVATLAGNYRVIATTSAGCTDSSTVTVISVDPKPTIPTVTLTGNTLTASATTGTYQWYSVVGTTLTPVAGATAQSFTPTVAGDYTVKIQVNGCDSDAPSAVSVVLGISSLAPGMKLDVYPNPTAGRFAVELTGFEKEATIQIVNLTGQLIAAETLAITSKNKTSVAFNLTGMAKGVYLLKVVSGQNVTIRKVVVD